MKCGIGIFIFAISITASFSQSIEGKWITIDDNTEKPRSIVEISKRGNQYFGEIIKLFREPEEDQDPICDECKGDKKNQKIIGLEIIEGLEEVNGEYKNGTILDPENGKVYDCKIWISEDGKMKVRGYLYFFFRTQTWLPNTG